MATTLLDEIEPSWHMREHHETFVSAPPRVVYDAALALPAGASTVMRILMGLRMAPARLMGSRSGWRGGEPTLIDAFRQRGFAVLGERPGEEIALGLAGWFWQVSPVVVRLNGRQDFENYREAGSARASINLRVEPLPGGPTQLSTETRVRCFGGAERQFRVYWALIGPFSAWIRRDWLRLIKQASETTTICLGT